MEPSILIIDDNLEFTLSLYKYIQCEILEIKKIYIASNEIEGYNFIRKFTPDIILLDVKKFTTDKIEVLRKVYVENIKIILIFNDIEFINKMDLQDFCNIVRFYTKPFEFSKLKEDLKLLIHKENDIKLENLINEELSEFNFNKASVGYRYLINCIIEISKYPEKLENIEKLLFPHVAIQLKINDSKVIKWSIQKLIDSMTRYTDEKIISKYFPHTKKPTIKLFLSIINRSLIIKYKTK